MTDFEAQETGWSPLGFLPAALVWLLLIAALSSSALLATQGERYLVWVVTFAVVLVLLSLELRLRSRTLETVAGSEDFRSPATLLGFPAHLAAETRRLHQSFDSADLETLKARVDRLCEDCVDPLIEARAQLGAQLGLSRFADMMTSFARGERCLNRAWSALTDAHESEARQAMAGASAAFQEAADKCARD